jgi:DNA invertase Pin-like site-specific DNA recombinase
MTTAGYIRVSSASQDHAMQRAAIARVAASRQDEVGTWYAEKMSGKTMARPELARLRADARAGLIRRLYVWRLDRLTRSGIRDTLDVVEEFRGARVELISISDGFNLEGPQAEIILAVMAWAAKMERIAINERIAGARERMKEEGKGWGRPRRLGPSDVARIRELRAQGRTIREIAVALKVPRSTVSDAVSEKVPPVSAE